MILLVLDGFNINAIIKILFLLYSQSLKPFFKKILENFRPLLIIFKVSLRVIFNINLKKPKSKYFIFNISNLFLQNLILLEFLIS